MKGTQQHFGDVSIRKNSNGICRECGQSSHIALMPNGQKNQYYCKIHAKQTWLEAIK